MQTEMLRFLGLMRRAGKLAVGETGTGQSAREGKAALILLASDASENAEDRARGFAHRAQVPLIRLKAEGENIRRIVSESKGTFRDISPDGEIKP